MYTVKYFTYGILINVYKLLNSFLITFVCFFSLLEWASLIISWSCVRFEINLKIGVPSTGLPNLKNVVHTYILILSMRMCTITSDYRYMWNQSTIKRCCMETLIIWLDVLLFWLWVKLLTGVWCWAEIDVAWILDYFLYAKLKCEQKHLTLLL